jgi:hypothetical protein
VVIDVRDSPELRAVILSLKLADSEVRKTMTAAARSVLREAWQSELRQRTLTRLENRVIVDSARATVSSQSFTLKAATSRRKLSGGLVPADDWASVELGAKWYRRTYTVTSRKGNPYRVTKLANRQFRPRRSKGYVAFPAAGKTGQRMVALYVSAIARRLHEISEGK